MTVKPIQYPAHVCELNNNYYKYFATHHWLPLYKFSPKLQMCVCHPSQHMYVASNYEHYESCLQLQYGVEDNGSPPLSTMS